MPSRDDELKIDLSDIFGGDVSEARQAVEKTEQLKAEFKALTQEERLNWESFDSKTEHELTEQEKQALHKIEEEKILKQKEEELEKRLQEKLASKERELEQKNKELQEKLTALQAKIPSAPVVAPPSAPVAAVPPDEGLSISFEDAPNPVEKLDTKTDSAVSLTPVAPMGSAVDPKSETPAEVIDPDVAKLQEMQMLQGEYEFLELYDEFRQVILNEISDLVGEKKANTMLARTVEMARSKYPDVFRNANWDSNGDILEDGTMDSRRLVENKFALEAGKQDVIYDTALMTLLEMRFQAVEKGLGTGLKNKLKSRMKTLVEERIKKMKTTGKNTKLFERLNEMLA